MLGKLILMGGGLSVEWLIIELGKYLMPIYIFFLLGSSFYI
jgi:hypothetical protein